MSYQTLKAALDECAPFPVRESRPGTPAPQATRYDKIMAVRSGLQARRQRGRFLSPKLFSEPGWDMLLELYAASLSQRRLTVTRLAERTATAMTTALRWITVLESEGLARRDFNPLDRRLVYIVLSPKGEEALDAFFDHFPADMVIL